MSNSNSTLVAQAAVIVSPITFTSTAVPATTRANIDLIIDMISLEGADIDVKRGFLDEMSPICRTNLYKILVDLKTATVDA